MWSSLGWMFPGSSHLFLPVKLWVTVTLLILPVGILSQRTFLETYFIFVGLVETSDASTHPVYPGGSH